MTIVMLTRFRRWLTVTVVCCCIMLYICCSKHFGKPKHEVIQWNLNPYGKSATNQKPLSYHRKKYLAPDFSKLETFLLFIGYPRSGSTLVGSLLDAHPNIVIANEYNILTQWKNYTQQERRKEYVCAELYNNSVAESLKEQRASFKKYYFHYHVPGLWQGRYDGHIKIIGDKKSTSTTRVLSTRGNRLLELTAALNVPVKFIHLIRNPFDNIATMVLRAAKSGLRMRAVEEGLQLNSPVLLEKQMHTYFKLAHMNSKLRQRFGDNVLDVHYSSFIRQPEIWLKTICDFLEVHCSDYYIRNSVKIVFKNETYTRRHIVWPEEIKQEILRNINSIDFLNGLKFEIS